MGAHHTITLDLNRSFTIIKDYWDTFSIKCLDEAEDVTNRAEVAALLIDEGLVNLCFVTRFMTVIKFHLNVSIPKKRKYSAKSHDSALNNFFSSVYDGVVRNTNFEVVKCFIIAGPGFIKVLIFC